MILITSGAYVDSEFGIELGKLPPSFLPVGNRKLYQHQFDALVSKFTDEQIWISLPKDFVIDPIYLNNLSDINVNLIFVPVGLYLAQSILYCINSIGIYDQTLRILHGDTLISSFVPNQDALSIARSFDDYAWEIEKNDTNNNYVWSGFFSFSNIPLLARELTSSGNDFVLAIKNYDSQIPMFRFESKDWLDFGHINTFYKARTFVTTQRSFNNLIINDGTVRKSGSPPEKILAEAQWFYDLPPRLKKFIPQLIDKGLDNKNNVFYETEYLCSIPLNEAFVHGRNTTFFWEKIFSICSKWFRESASFGGSISNNDCIQQRRSIVIKKSIKRIEEYFSKETNLINCAVNLNGTTLPSISVITTQMYDLVEKSKVIPGVIHGDLCLSNMIFDSRSESLKLIDPRGMDDEGNKMLYGDITYDIAKLTHSIIGLYDLIISKALYAKRYQMTFEFEVDIDQRLMDIQGLYMKTILKHIDINQVLPQVILLFLSMLPLHTDSKIKQDTLLANALRLYDDFYS